MAMIGNPRDSEFSCALRTAIIDTLSENALTELDSIKQTRVFEPGERLFNEGETPRCLFVLCTGAVKLFMSSGNGRTLPLRAAGPGEILGLSPLLSNRPYDASAEVEVPSKIGLIDREQVLRFFSQNQELGIRFLELLSKDVHSCYELVRSFGDRVPRHRM